MGPRIVRLRGGEALVISIAAVVVLVGFAALTIDVGHLILRQAALQNAADAAAKAATFKLLEGRGSGMSESDARAAATAEAQNFVTLNAPAARCEVAFGSYENGVFTARDASVEAMAVRVTACRDSAAAGGPVTMMFASLMGVGAVSVDAAAVCKMVKGIYAIGSDLRPFGIPVSAITGIIPGDIFVFNLPQKPWEPLWEGEELSPGNFGWLNLNGGAQSTQELVEWVQNGYPELFVIDPQVGYRWIDGTCGVRASLQNDLQSVIGRDLFVCVYDQIEGNGANANFRVVRFACVTILEVRLSGNDKYIKCRYNRLSYVPVCLIGKNRPEDNICKVLLVE
jgi:Flp pilus assembly protein TadG